MKVLREFFTENKKLSLMRGMSAAALATGIIIAIIGLLISKDLIGVTELTSVFVISAFGGKVAQKAIEKK